MVRQAGTTAVSKASWEVSGSIRGITSLAGFMGVILVNLFLDQIDERKTISKTEKFLEELLPEFINYSGLPLADLSSPALDPAGIAGGSNVNHADNKFIKNIEKMTVVQKCECSVDAVIETINSCSDTQRQPYKSILFRKYVKRDFDLWIYQDMNLSKSKFRELKREAILQFAKKSLRYREKYSVETMIPKLLVFTHKP